MENQSHISSISITPSMGRQTQGKEFGQVLRDAMKTGVSSLGVVSGLVAGAPGLGIVSAAVSSVTNVVSRGTATANVGYAATGAVPVSGNNQGTSLAASGSGLNGSATSIDAAAPAEFNSMISLMRQEADRSVAVQMQMQTESREYNTLSNVLKTRHDSAKAAINNIR